MAERRRVTDEQLTEWALAAVAGTAGEESARVVILAGELRASRALVASLLDSKLGEHDSLVDQLRKERAERETQQQRIDKALAWLPAPGVDAGADAIRAVLTGGVS